ncbi:efflux RND transporter periplasmic adaptor subunit, partial [bacterium]|nr:efflux RND transporter periplasmic adaptor subunit [bacterium]
PARTQGPGHGPTGARPAQQAVPVAVSAAASGAIASYYDATASLEAEKTAQVLARVTGQILAISAEEGDRVDAGGALLRIDNDEYRFRVEQAEANTANLHSRFARMESMRAEDLASEEEFQSALSELENARAEEGLARLSLSYTTVRAPFAGRITQRLVDVGQNVSVGTPLFDLADFDPLLARVHVPSREFNKLRHDQDVDLELDSDGTRLEGRIKLISPVIDPASGTIKVTVEVSDCPASVRPGDFAVVRIVTEQRENAILVPRGAVLTDKGETVVFVPVAGAGEDGETVAERRIVETGFTDDDHTEIVAGLVPGDMVVVKGQRSLKHGTLLKILESGEAGGR